MRLTKYDEQHEPQWATVAFNEFAFVEYQTPIKKNMVIDVSEIDEGII
jgi:hypothetical protein